jgi:SAM-dependent methyltransferase
MDLERLTDLATPWSVRVAATLRIAEHVRDGVSDVDALAKAAGCDPDALRRILGTLVGAGVFTAPEPGRVELNEAAEQLLDPSVHIGLDLDGIGGRFAGAWAGLLTAARTGGAGYPAVFGAPYWDDLAAHPEIGASFDALMGPEGHGPPSPDVLVGGWDGVRTVVDVGGGTGSVLAAVLADRPELHGVLVDLPGPAEQAAATFAAAGVQDRVTISAQSFFDPLPAGADVYLLRSVLADWPEREAAAILRRCAEAARPAGRVVVLGGVTPGPAATDDLLMLVLLGGKERTLPEFRELARSAGLEVVRTGLTGGGRYAVECRPA